MPLLSNNTKIFWNFGTTVNVMLILEHMLEQLSSRVEMKKWKSWNLKPHGFISANVRALIYFLLQNGCGIWESCKLAKVHLWALDFLQNLHIFLLFRPFCFMTHVHQVRAVLRSVSRLFCSNFHGKYPPSPRSEPFRSSLHGKSPRKLSYFMTNFTFKNEATIDL